MKASILYLRAIIAVEGQGIRPFTTIEVIPLDLEPFGGWAGMLQYDRRKWRVVARIEEVQNSPADPNQMALPLP